MTSISQLDQALSTQLWDATAAADSGLATGGRPSNAPKVTLEISAWLSSSVAAMHTFYAHVTSIPAAPEPECCQFVTVLVHLTVQALVPTMLLEQAAALSLPPNPHNRPTGRPSCS